MLYPTVTRSSRGVTSRASSPPGPRMTTQLARPAVSVGVLDLLRLLLKKLNNQLHMLDNTDSRGDDRPIATRCKSSDEMPANSITTKRDKNMRCVTGTTEETQRRPSR